MYALALSLVTRTVFFDSKPHLFHQGIILYVHLTGLCHIYETNCCCLRSVFNGHN